MAAALRACGYVLVRLGGGGPFAVFHADLANGRNARIPTLVRSSGRVRCPLTGDLAREYPEALLASLRKSIRFVSDQNKWEPGDPVRLIFPCL
jgi:hypothetical protein